MACPILHVVRYYMNFPYYDLTNYIRQLLFKVSNKNGNLLFVTSKYSNFV